MRIYIRIKTPRRALFEAQDDSDAELNFWTRHHRVCDEIGQVGRLVGKMGQRGVRLLTSLEKEIKEVDDGQKSAKSRVSN